MELPHEEAHMRGRVDATSLGLRPRPRFWLVFGGFAAKNQPKKALPQKTFMRGAHTAAMNMVADDLRALGLAE